MPRPTPMRVLLPVALVLGGGWWWFGSGDGAVAVTSEDLERARSSGLGSADVRLPEELHDGTGPLPESLAAARALADRPARRAALDALQAALATHPECGELLVITSELERWLGEDAAALAHARAGAERLRDRSWAHFVLARAQGDQLVRLGRGGPLDKLQAARGFGAYRDSLETTVQLDGTHVAALKELILVLALSPEGVGGDRERALVLCAQLERADPMQGILSRARVLSSAGDLDGALACCQDAAARFPDSTEPPWIEGSVLLAAGRHDAADAAFARVLAGVRDETWYQASIARARLRNDTGQQPDQVLADMDAYLAADPAFEWSPPAQEAHLERGRALAALGRSQEARAALELAVQLDPRLPGAREALAALDGR